MWNRSTGLPDFFAASHAVAKDVCHLTSPALTVGFAGSAPTRGPAGCWPIPAARAATALVGNSIFPLPGSMTGADPRTTAFAGGSTYKVLVRSSVAGVEFLTTFLTGGSMTSDFDRSPPGGWPISGSVNTATAPTLNNLVRHRRGRDRFIIALLSGT